MTAQKQPRTAPADPFFRLLANSEWNACIGPQASDENYVDGYIEAAIELAAAVIDKRMHAKRDTLAMPILYNARHGVELALKYAINQLHGMGVLKATHPPDHDVLSHWTLLNDSALGDRALRGHIAALKSYVTSLSLIDDDGQELRYATRRDGQASLPDRPLANIAVIRDSLAALHKTLTSLKDRVHDLAQERDSGSFTAECSRRDLLEIAGMLPPKSAWTEAVFDEAKVAVRSRFNLSSRKFSHAVNIIKSCREMKLLIGLETNLLHLSDQNARLVVEQWCRRHPQPPEPSDLGVVRFADIDWEAMREQDRIAAEVNAAIVAALTPEEIADLETVFYIGRDNPFCEHYQRLFESTRQKHRVTNNLTQEVNHLMEKTNFRKALAAGIGKLGRPALADELRAIGAG